MSWCKMAKCHIESQKLGIQNEKVFPVIDITWYTTVTKIPHILFPKVVKMGSHFWEKNHQTKRMSAQKYLDNLERYICLNLKPGSFNILLSANLKCHEAWAC